jgi:hypothetical protein
MQSIALLGEGDHSRIVLKGCAVADNGVGVQVAEKVTLSAEGCVFHLNGIHINALRGATIAVTGTPNRPVKFSKTRDRLGTHIHDAWTASFADCEFSGEINGCTFQNNGACGIQLMSGQVTRTGNTIESHRIFGVQVHPGAEIVDPGGNILAKNTKKEINYE